MPSLRASNRPGSSSADPMRDCGCRKSRAVRGREMEKQERDSRSPRDDLYRNIIMSHYRTSPHRHGMEDADFSSGQVNRSCGDKVELFVRIRDGKVDEASFAGEGCSLCMASASILCQEVRGLSPGDAARLAGTFRDFLGGDEPEYHDWRGGSDALSALGSVRSYGARIPCVLLSWNILDSLCEAVTGESHAAGD